MSGGLAELARLDATALLRVLSARRISAAELLEASIARANEIKGLRAVIRRETGAARERARLIDARLGSAETAAAIGALAGLPMTIKDSFDVEHLPASAGVSKLAQRHCDDAEAVARLRGAGAVLWAKTNVPAMAGDAQTWNRAYGTTRNPWDPRLTSGGSSGGAAVAVAAGVSALELGSDHSGSLRIPASFCGVFAHKPTHGLVSTHGHVPPQPGSVAEPDLLVAGPIARSARDLRLMLQVITGGPLGTRSGAATLLGLKAALWVDEPAFPLDPEVRDVVENFAGALVREGARVEAVDHLLDARALIEAFAVLLFSAFPGPAPSGLAMSWARMARALGAERYSGAGLTLARGASHAEWLEANEVRARIEQSLRAVFAHYDVILAPCATVAAFPHDHHAAERRRLKLSDGRKVRYSALLDWSALASACGLPVTVVPAGRTRRGLPVGVQIIGPRGADARTLAVAEAVDGAIAGFTPPPL